MKDNFKTVYFDNLFELYSLYTKVRDAVILVENFDRNRDMYIAPRVFDLFLKKRSGACPLISAQFDKIIKARLSNK